MIMQDIRILKELGFSVTVATRFKQIPWNCELYFSWWASGSIYPFIKAYLIRKPIIVVAGGSEAICARDSISHVPFGYLAYSWYKRLAIRLCLRFSTVVLFVSKFMLKDAKKLRVKNPIVVYNAVDTDIFQPSDSLRSYVTTIFHQHEQIVMIKRGEVFLRAVKNVLEKYPNEKFVVIGEHGDDYERLKKLIKELNIENYVEFIGLINHEQIPQLLRQTKIYVQISDSETFGLSVAEAMASGTPVVVSKRGALPEVVGELGTYVDHNDPDSVATGIIGLLDKTDEERTELGLKSRQRIIEKFSCKQRKEAIRQIINNL
jgi:glycosyltransferase involved in cell wall biosynthesis